MKLIVLAGAMGSGVEFVADEILKNESIKPVIPTVTRPKLEGEVDGENFKFISEEEFEKLFNGNEFIEARAFNGEKEWFGGVAKSSLELESDNTYVTVTTPEGVVAFKEYVKSLKTEKPVEIEAILVHCNAHDRLMRLLNTEKQLLDLEVMSVCNNMVEEYEVFEKHKDYFDLVLKLEKESDFKKCVGIISGLV